MANEEEQTPPVEIPDAGVDQPRLPLVGDTVPTEPAPEPEDQELDVTEDTPPSAIG